ncbi:uncharacterized protein LOC143033426 [Oratosquilla oratoria]|uniref:uncharacterized protein LOC143033426 n=1 Tax=Oratosquilla oratoria TaxID=337810 RepID=UPI003F769C71
MSGNPDNPKMTRNLKNRKTNSCCREDIKGRKVQMKCKTSISSATVPQLIVQKIQALLKGYPAGLDLEKFSRAYMRRMGHPLYPEQHGFTDLIEMLRTLKTILKIENHGNGKVLIRGVKEGEVKTEKEVNESSEQLVIEPSSSSLCAETLGIFRDILKKHNNGIVLDDLPHLYQISCGKKLDVEALGFVNVLDLASQLRDVFSIITTDYKEYFLYGAEVDPGPILKDLKLQNRKTEIEKTRRKFRSSTIERLTRLLEDDFPEGLSIEELVGAYRGLYGASLTDLECTQYGYLSLQALLRAHPEVVNLHHWGGVVIVQAASVTLQDSKEQQQEESENCQIAGTGYSNKTISTSEHYKSIDPGILETGDMIDVVVAEVFSPRKFWIILRGEETSKGLDELMDRMFEFYSSPVGNRFKVPPAVTLGAPVVSLYEDDQNYYRALIVSIEDLKTVKLFYVDFGTVCQADVACLWLLHEKFFSLPAQAVKASLFGIEPVDGSKKWPKETSVAFLNLVQNRPFVCSINNMKNCVLFVSLWNTENDGDINIADILVKRKLAKYNDDSSCISHCQKKVTEYKDDSNNCSISQCFYDRSLSFHENVVEDPSNSKVASENCLSTKSNASLSLNSFDYVNNIPVSESLSYTQQKEVIKVLQNKLRDAYELLEHSQPQTCSEFSSWHMVEKNGNITSTPKVTDQMLESQTPEKLSSSAEHEELLNSKCLVNETFSPKHSLTGVSSQERISTLSGVEWSKLKLLRCEKEGSRPVLSSPKQTHIDIVGSTEGISVDFWQEDQLREIKSPGSYAEVLSGYDLKQKPSQCFKVQSENVLLSGPTQEEHLYRNHKEFISNNSVISSANSKSFQVNGLPGTKIQVENWNTGGEDVFSHQETNQDMIHCMVPNQNKECLVEELVKINEEEYSLPLISGQGEIELNVKSVCDIRDTTCSIKNSEKVISKEIGEELKRLMSDQESDFKTDVEHTGKDECLSSWLVSKKISENGLQQEQYIQKERTTNQQVVPCSVHEIKSKPQIHLSDKGSNSAVEHQSKSMPLKEYVDHFSCGKQSEDKVDIEQSCKVTADTIEIDYSETRGSSNVSTIKESSPKNLINCKIMINGSHSSELGCIENNLPHHVIISDPHYTPFSQRNKSLIKSNMASDNQKELDLIVSTAEPRCTEESKVRSSTNDFETKTINTSIETNKFCSLSYEIPIKEVNGYTKEGDFSHKCTKIYEERVQNEASVIYNLKTQENLSQNLNELDTSFVESLSNQRVTSPGQHTNSMSSYGPRKCLSKLIDIENENFGHCPNRASEFSLTSSESHKDGQLEKSNHYGYTLGYPSQTSSEEHLDRHQKSHKCGEEEFMGGKDQWIVTKKAESLLKNNEKAATIVTIQGGKFDSKHSEKSSQAEEQASKIEVGASHEDGNESLIGHSASLYNCQKPVNCELAENSISEINCALNENINRSKTCMKKLDLSLDIDQRENFFQKPVQYDLSENCASQIDHALFENVNGSKAFTNKSKKRENYSEDSENSVHTCKSWVDSYLKYLHQKMKLTVSRVHWKRHQSILPQECDTAIDKTCDPLEGLQVTNENYKTMNQNEIYSSKIFDNPKYCITKKDFMKEPDENFKANRINKNIVGTFNTHSYGQQGSGVTRPIQTSGSSNNLYGMNHSQVTYAPSVIPQWWQWPRGNLPPIYTQQYAVDPTHSIKPPNTFSFGNTRPHIQDWSNFAPKQNPLMYLPPSTPHVPCGVYPFDHSMQQLACPLVSMYPSMYMMTPPSFPQ